MTSDLLHPDPCLSFLFLHRNLEEDKTVWDFPWELCEGGETVKIFNPAVT